MSGTRSIYLLENDRCQGGWTNQDFGEFWPSDPVVWSTKFCFEPVTDNNYRIHPALTLVFVGSYTGLTFIHWFENVLKN